MKFSAKQYAQALKGSLERSNPKDEDRILDNFVKILAEYNDLRLFDQIAREYHKMELAKNGIKQVELTSAKPLDKQSEQEILDQLNMLVKGKIEVRKEIDEQLIGGVVIRMDDQLIDASIKNGLEQLKSGLAK